jgi:outer membrane protein OmpU
MKKLLIASTALVATTSVAAADITFDGLARFALLYVENDNPALDETSLDTRFRLNITGSTETDGGVEFSARFRFETNDTNGGQIDASNAWEAPEFSVQAGGLRLDLGGTNDVIESADIVNYYGASTFLTFAVGETATSWQIPTRSFGNPGAQDPVVKARYSVGAITVAASYLHNANDNSPETWQVGARYDVNDAIGVGLIYGNEDDGTGAGDNDFWVLGADGSVGAFGYNVVIADYDGVDDTSYGLGLTYAISSATEVRFVASDNGVTGDDTEYSVGFRHSLGGGVQLGGGIGTNNEGNDLAELGVQFNF